jgi:hypothetical protein
METAIDADSLVGRVQHYWNERIHDLEMTEHAPGTAEFFADLDEYRFDKLRYLPKVVDFNGYAGKKGPEPTGRRPTSESGSSAIGMPRSR